jgi:hypothetical protein
MSGLFSELWERLYAATYEPRALARDFPTTRRVFLVNAALPRCQSPKARSTPAV